MKQIFSCRRSSLALIAMVILAGLSAYLKIDMSGSIAMIAMGVAVANAGQAAAAKFANKDKPEA